MFDARESAVLKFTTALINSRGNANAEECEAAFAQMRDHFDEPQLVELGLAIATLTGMNLFNNMFGIETEGQPMVSNTGLDPSASAAAE